MKWKVPLLKYKVIQKKNFVKIMFSAENILTYFKQRNLKMHFKLLLKVENSFRNLNFLNYMPYRKENLFLLIVDADNIIYVL